MGPHRVDWSRAAFDSFAVKVLALDLSTRQGSVAFGSSEGDLEETSWPNERRNSGPFFEHLQQIRSQHGAANVVVTGLGPGSYAGTRISVATATGLALSWNARLVGAPSLCAFPSERPDYVVIGDARRDAFFYAEIRDRTMAAGVELLALNELQDRLNARSDLVVYSSDALPQFPQARLNFPSARELARLVLKDRPALVAAPLQPLYLREPSITLPKAPRAVPS